MNPKINTEPSHIPIDKISKALFIINRHAKTAIDSKYLYTLKHETIKKLLSEGKAQKIGLHYSRNPKYSQQQLDVLISVGTYYFHIPPTKEDIQSLKNLGALNDHYRNPKTVFPLKEAKKILQMYTGIQNKDTQHQYHHQSYPRYTKPVFKRLGK